jgi:serine/threonine protein kinase
LSLQEYCSSRFEAGKYSAQRERINKHQGTINHIQIADFGISGVSKEFNPYANVGTLKYMAP